jgi:hypothetical protein
MDKGVLLIIFVFFIVRKILAPRYRLNCPLSIH